MTNTRLFLKALVSLFVLLTTATNAADGGQLVSIKIDGGHLLWNGDPRNFHSEYRQ